jgi:hypothetical protein
MSQQNSNLVRTGCLLSGFVIAGAFLSSSVLAQTSLSKPAVNAPAEPPAMNQKEVIGSEQGTLTAPSVFFISPKDGATVGKEFDVKFGIKGMKISPAGAVVPGSGHHHLIIDGVPAAKGQVVVADATHMHFGKGQTETKLKLAPGPHKLTLQFADGSHRSYGEQMSQTITVNVK